MSNNSKQIKLVAVGAQAYAKFHKESKVDVTYPVDVTEELKKIDQENGIVLIFPPGYHVLEAEGDQETGKSSLQKLLLEATGNILAPNAINSIDNDKKFFLRLWGLDGYLYHVRATKATYTVERIETDEAGAPITNEKGKEVKLVMAEPKTAIRKIAGPAGISPLRLAELEPKEQITWLRSLYTLSPEVLKEERELKTKYETAYKERTKAGGKYDDYKALVENNAYYKEHEHWTKYFSETSFQNLEEEYQTIQKEHGDYVRYESNLKTLKEITLVNAETFVEQSDTEINSIKNQILSLQQRLLNEEQKREEKIKNVEGIKEKISKNEEWMLANISIKEKYESLNVKVQEATEFKANKQAFDQLNENMKQMNHFSDEYIRLTTIVDALAETKKKFVESFSPKVEGFEVCIPDEGNEDKREGIFYKGKPLNFLAESELWEMALQLWKELNVRMVFVENINGLGSGAVEMFNKFIESGGYVFATMMNRAEKNLKITFSNIIE